MSEEYYQCNGLGGSSGLYFVAKHFRRALVLLSSNHSFSDSEKALEFFSGPETPVLSFPSFEFGYSAVREDPTISYRRISALSRSQELQKENFFFLSSAKALSQLSLPKAALKNSTLELKKGEWIERDQLIKRLKGLGYFQDDLAQDQGFFSIRGHLLDLYSPYETKPFRFEFFGDEIVSIRTFDPSNQRSLKELDSAKILPCRELVFNDESLKTARKKLKDLGDSLGVERDERERVFLQITEQKDLLEGRWLLPAFYPELESALAYLPKDLPIVIFDPERAKQELERDLENDKKDYRQLDRLAYSPESLRSDLESLFEKPYHHIDSVLSSVGSSYKVLDLSDLRPQLIRTKNFEPLKQRILSAKEADLQIELVFHNERKMELLKESIPEVAEIVDWELGPLFPGFESSTLRKFVATERDIFGTKRKTSSSKNVGATEFLRQFSDLKNGDYVVHDVHGVAFYRGLVQLSVGDQTSEFLLLEYADADKLYVPIYRVDQVSRYVSGDSYASPSLDRLGSGAFEKKKRKAKDDILKVAHELLDLAAARKLSRIDRPKINEELYTEFCHEFPYELTADQETTIRSVESDLQAQKPMDRLVCGDVGFGKTEVALRAAMFRLLQGKQVAVLAPTTLLVEQHFRNFERRFRNFDFKIDQLSRFVSDKQARATVEDIKNGAVDLVVGTHRLFQKDIKFKNLGLLIVDEEQRFGVKHKEKIKKLQSEVDLLTLSATPIPRTLQMAITGIRELSLITTAPETREAVATQVGSFDDELIQRAAQREFLRSGQILFVHNRVKSIYRLKEHLEKVLPKLRIGIAHGQMAESELEKVMIEFVDQKLDLLLATSIIENGLDIPNANTLFVDHAEQFGLSDLYQLRGRVGRGHQKAYSYFLIHDETPLSVEASKRLQVIQSCTDLGSGFRVATHDLEIRGAGNLLGEQQSGLISEVGLELYNQMLEDCLREIKHEGRSEKLPELSSGYSAYIPDHYIPDASVRISTYRRLNRVGSQEKLIDFEDELLDRFGLYPNEVNHLCQLTRLKLYAHLLKASSIDVYPGKMSLVLREETDLQPEKLMNRLGEDLQIQPNGKLVYYFDSALKNTDVDLGKNESKELYDFELCRKLLIDLCKMASIPVH